MTIDILFDSVRSNISNLKQNQETEDPEMVDMAAVQNLGVLSLDQTLQVAFLGKPEETFSGQLGGVPVMSFRSEFRSTVPQPGAKVSIAYGPVIVLKYQGTGKRANADKGTVVMTEGGVICFSYAVIPESRKKNSPVPQEEVYLMGSFSPVQTDLLYQMRKFDQDPDSYSSARAKEVLEERKVELLGVLNGSKKHYRLRPGPAYRALPKMVQEAIGIYWQAKPIIDKVQGTQSTFHSSAGRA